MTKRRDTTTDWIKLGRAADAAYTAAVTNREVSRARVLRDIFGIAGVPLPGAAVCPHSECAE